MVRWFQLVIIFTASAFVLGGCNSETQNFLGVDKASNNDTKAYSIENNKGVVVYKDNGVYNSTGMGHNIYEDEIVDVEFEIDYPQDPIGY